MEQKDYRLAAIMYTDIAGFSAMMERDEAGTLRMLAWHNDLIKGIVTRHHGTVIKTIGDAILADFRNTVEALSSALEIQAALQERNARGDSPVLMLRIGIHLGDIYFFENDALGEGINIASRLQSIAQPGGICISRDVYNIVLNKIPFDARAMGSVQLKNISKEILAYTIASPGLLPPEPVVAADAPLAPSPEKEMDRPSLTAQPGFQKEQGDILGTIRTAILDETRSSGRRMTVREAREKYGYYGIEATEVIASLAERGILKKDDPEYDLSGASTKENKTGHAPSHGSHPGHETAQRRASNPASDRSANKPDTETSRPEPALGQQENSGLPHPEEYSFSGRELGKTIENAVHGIVDEIQRSIESGMSGNSHQHGSGSIRMNFSREDGQRLKEEIKSGVKEVVAEAKAFKRSRRRRREDPDAHGEYENYKNKLVSQAAKHSKGLSGNIISFILVNAGLWALNLTTSPTFLWAGIVSAAWGIGVVSSIVEVLRSRRQVLEIEAIPEPEKATLDDIKKLNKERDAMSGHAVSTVTVPSLLFVINMLTSPDSPWFLIPSGILLVTCALHYLGYLAKVPLLKRKIYKALNIRGGLKNLRKAKEERASTVNALGPYASYYDEAVQARTALDSQLTNLKAPFAADIRPDLDRYVGQVKLLAQSAHEIDRLVEAIPMDALHSDRDALLAKVSKTQTASLKAEYAASIAEIEKQETSFNQLAEQSEVIRLRLGSSVNQLKQMRLDLARLKAAGSDEMNQGLGQIREKAGELAHYLDDLKSATAEEMTDPFAELERLEAEGRLPGQKSAERISLPPGK